jgi:nucleoid DNA-binding protein
MHANKTTIERTIEQLLHRHECVILPDFGGFIVRDSPCNFNAAKDAIKPFAKHIFFNPHLLDNDGLLVSAIQNAENLSYSEALEFCKSAIVQIRLEIEQNSNRTFGKLGTFHKGQNSIWFAPNTNINLSVESYGLKPINVVQVHSVAEQKEETAFEIKSKTTESAADKTPIISIEIPKKGLKPWLVAASVALLAHLIYLGVETKTKNLQEASVLPSIEVNVPEIQNKQILESTNLDTPILAQEFESSETVAIVNEAEPEVNHVIESSAAAAAPVIIETIAPVEIQNKTIARYRIESNAKYHASDLNKNGQTAGVIRNGEWFEVTIAQ